MSLKENCHIRLYDHNRLVATFNSNLDPETMGIEIMKLIQEIKNDSGGGHSVYNGLLKRFTCIVWVLSKVTSLYDIVLGSIY